MRKIKTGNVEISPDEFNPKKGKFRVNMFVDLDVVDEIRLAELVARVRVDVEVRAVEVDLEHRMVRKHPPVRLGGAASEVPAADGHGRDPRGVLPV